MPHAIALIESCRSNCVTSLQVAAIALLFGLTSPHAYCAATDLDSSHTVNMAAVLEERHQVRDQLDELEKQLNTQADNSALREKIKLLQNRLSQLAGDVIRLSQQQVSRHQLNFGQFEHPLPSDTKDKSKNAISDELAAGIRRYKANVDFLHKLLQSTFVKLNQKIRNSPVLYDNRHFTLLKKERPHLDTSTHLSDKKKELITKSFQKSWDTLKAKIEHLPALNPRTSSEEAINREITTNLKVIESLRLSIVSTAYAFEERVNNIANNLTTAAKLKPQLLKLYKKKIKSAYTPNELSPRERLQFKDAKAIANNKLEIRFNEFVDSTEHVQKASSTFKSYLQLALDEVIQEYTAHARKYTEEKKGSFGYLGEFHQIINTRLSADSFLTLMAAREALPKVSKPPYPFYYHVYNQLKNSIDQKRNEFLETVGNDIRKLQLGNNENPKPGISLDLVPVPAPGSLAKLQADHQELLDKAYQTIRTGVEFWYFDSLGKNSCEQFRKILVSADSKKLKNSESLLLQAESLQKEFAKTLKETNGWKEMKIAFDAYSAKVEILSQEVISMKSSADESKQKLEQSSANLEKEMMDLAQEIKTAKELGSAASLHFNSLRKVAIESVEGFENRRNKLKSEIASEEQRIFTFDRESIQLKLDLLTEDAGKLRNIVSQFQQVFDGVIEISRTLNWSSEFFRNLSSLNSTLDYSAQKEIEDSSKNLDEQLDTDRKTLAAVVKLILGSFEAQHRFDGGMLQQEILRARAEINPLLKNVIENITKIFSKLKLSYDDIALGQSFWRITNPKLAMEKARRITELLTTKPALFDSALIEGWKNFSGYLGLSLAASTGDLRILDDLAIDFRTLDSGPFKDQFAVDTHYVPPFAFANSKTLPGLKNFGATCYLNALTKAIETSGLQKLFSPTYQLIQRIKKLGESDADFKLRSKGREEESDLEFNLRSKNHKEISLFLSALGNSTNYDSKLENFHLHALTALGNLLIPLFDIPQGSWMQHQQDPEEALGSILDEFASQDNSFWKLGTGRLSDTRAAKE
ncbi:MAG: hypothetical protein ABIQ95_05945, partial [Bdellovibrionia bacterium]